MPHAQYIVIKFLLKWARFLIQLDWTVNGTNCANAWLWNVTKTVWKASHQRTFEDSYPSVPANDILKVCIWLYETLFVAFFFIWGERFCASRKGCCNCVWNLRNWKCFNGSAELEYLKQFYLGKFYFAFT